MVQQCVKWMYNCVEEEFIMIPNHSLKGKIMAQVVGDALMIASALSCAHFINSVTTIFEYS